MKVAFSLIATFGSHYIKQLLIFSFKLFFNVKKTNKMLVIVKYSTKYELKEMIKEILLNKLSLNLLSLFQCTL